MTKLETNLIRLFKTCLSAAIFFGSTSYGLANPSVPPNFTPGAYNAGTLNTHDMEMLKQRQLMQQEQKDYTQYQYEKQQNQNKDTKQENIEQQTQAPAQIKAKISEFETKGVFIARVNFTSSSIFSDQELNDFAKTIQGKNVFIENIESMVESINNAYAEKGYVTARAFLLPQTMDDGTLEIELIEGRVGTISVEESRWTRDYYIKSRISEKPGELFDIIKLEQDILKFNRYNDGIKLKADLFPGVENRTTDINIQTAETFPFHMTAMMDNAGRSTIGVLRGGINLQADSLFELRDRLSIGSYKSRSSITPYADYNIPVNKYDGRVGFMYSSSISDITSGDFSMFNIQSRSNNFSLYYSHPLIRKPNFELTGVTSANYKQATTSFDGNDLYTDKITSAQASLNAKYDSQKGIWYGSQTAYHAFPMIEKESKYFKYEGSLVRLHDFGRGIVGQFRINYQYIPQDVVPYVDQFQSGGLATVRGYTEGLLIGKSGYFTSSEIMFPIAPSTVKVKSKTIPDKIEKKPFFGKWVKGAVFLDHAGVFPFKGKGPGLEGITVNDYLASAGLGLRITLPGELTGRLYWGYPFIRNTHEYAPRQGRFHFELSLSPDFYNLVQLGKEKRKKQDIQMVNNTKEIKYNKSVKPVKNKKANKKCVNESVKNNSDDKN